MTTAPTRSMARVPRQRRRPLESSPAPAPAGTAAAGDVVPLAQRIGGLSVLRAVLTTTVIGLLAADGRADLTQLAAAVAYVGCGALAGAALVLVHHRGAAVLGFGLLLCADGVMVQCGRALLGPGIPGDLLLAVFLSAVCLLGSFRTGIKLAIWQSLLQVIESRGRETGLFADLPPGAGDPLATRLLLMWLLVVVVCSAAAVNERELRRRRHDAEALQQFATTLHEDADPVIVLDRLVGFVVDELDAGRVLICRATGGELEPLAGRDLGPLPDRSWSAAGEQRSELLALADATRGPVPVLTLDATLDPWLVQVLPGAHRVIALPLAHDAGEASTWLLFEHRGRPRTRLERRVVAATAQAAAIAALALSRARLFQASMESARTDGLTGIPNRRAFDHRLAELCAGRDGFAVVLTDVDHFKAVNDVHGHGAGDEVLRVVARTLLSAAPGGAMVARYGGEEFVVLLPGAGAGAGAAAAERMRAALAASTEGPVRVTASFGVAAVAAAEDVAGSSLLAAADAALYRAKAGGRNRVEIATWTSAASHAEAPE